MKLKRLADFCGELEDLCLKYELEISAMEHVISGTSYAAPLWATKLKHTKKPVKSVKDVLLNTMKALDGDIE